MAYLLHQRSPGCGKSSFMRRLAAVFENRCPLWEQIPCSSDPDSLDAVIFPEWKVSIADATAPHALEPKYPGLSESILSFGDFLDPLKIKPYGETIRLISQTTSKNYSQAIDCLARCQKLFERLPSHCTEQLKSAKTKCLCKTFFL